MVTLTLYDYEAIGTILGVPVKTIQAGLDSKKSLHNFNIQQLKSIIKYLRDKGARVNLTGNKGVLIDNISRVLWDDSAPAQIKPSNQTIASLLPVGHGGHVTIEHNTSSWQQPWTASKQASFNDENFLGKQVPFFEHVSILTAIPFLAREDMHQRTSFNVDEATYALLKEKTRAIHARFFSKERKGDIPWNIDVVLKINGAIIDIQKLARKIRSKAYKEPYILPRPADVSHVIRSGTNTVEFCHPGESGFLILHVVKEIDIGTLISNVITNKAVSGSRANMKNDDIEEMNYVLSMKCPLSCMRIETPVRSKNCTHEQCFDLRSYLEYSYQQQIWHCPVCEIGAPYKDLIYDEHFKSILVSFTADKVTVHPDGTIVDADTEPTPKRPKLNTPSTPTPPSASTTPISSSSTPLPPSLQPPPMVIALDSPPPSPPPPPSLPSFSAPPPNTTSSNATPFVFSPPNTTTTTTLLPANVPPSFESSLSGPSTPSAIPPQLPTSPVTPFATPSTPFSPFSPPPEVPPLSTSSSSLPPPQTPPPQNPTPHQNGTPTTPSFSSSSPSPSSTPSPSSAPSHPSNHQVIDLKQEPGLIKKILQTLNPATLTRSTPTLPPPLSTSTPPTSLPPTSAPSTTSSPSPSSATASTASISSPSLSSHTQSLPAPPTPTIDSPSASGGNTSSDAIVISDDDD